MLPALVEALLFVTLPLVHDPARFSTDRVRRLRARQIQMDLYSQVWGGPPGLTPRTDPEQQQLEYAILPWAEALESHPDLRKLGLRPRR